MKRINLITTCSNSKTATNDTLKLCSIKQDFDNLHNLANKWSNLIDQMMHKNYGLCASTLYKGGHWSNALKATSGLDVDLWVVSAGLGLLHSDDFAINYQATFSSGQADSIPLYGLSKTESSQRWWHYLCKIRTSYSKLNSISTLMQERCDEIFIIAGSNVYIEAIYCDLIDGMMHLTNATEQLAIITSKNSSYEKCNLKDNNLFSSKRMMSWLKCNMTSLNVSLANKLITILIKNDYDLIAAKKTIINKLDELPSIIKSTNIKCTDMDLRKYIRNEIEFNSSVSATKCLLKLRKNGLSAEEHRFRTIFSEIKNSYK